jgi:probable phosphoglycerate mutase
MQLYFVRHGQSEANRLNEIANRGLRHGLTAQGRAQAAALAQTLRDKAIYKLYTSPLLRAQQTAEILAQALGVPVEIADALREYDCGTAEGRSDAAAWALYQAAAEAWARGEWGSRIEGGESVLDMEVRFRPFLTQLIRTHRTSQVSVVLISHGGLYRWMLPRVLANVDLGFALAHPISYTDAVIATPGSAGLVCSEWCGQVVPATPLG